MLSADDPECCLSNDVTHRGTRPDAKLSTPNRPLRITSFFRVSALNVGDAAFCVTFDGSVTWPCSVSSNARTNPSDSSTSTLSVTSAIALLISRTSSSHRSLRSVVRNSLMIAQTIYRTKMTRSACPLGGPLLVNQVVNHPAVSEPHADASPPTRLYHAKMVERSEADTSWASVDSSIALKGPISLPLWEEGIQLVRLSGKL